MRKGYTYNVCHKKQADSGLELISYETKVFLHSVQSVQSIINVLIAMM